MASHTGTSIAESHGEAAVSPPDFGPEAEAEILEPETAKTYEVGAKGRHLGGRFEWELSLFNMEETRSTTVCRRAASG